MVNVNQTLRESDDFPQKTVETILKLFKVGTIPNDISTSLGVSLEKVIQILSQVNEGDLFNKIITKFGKKSRKLRCAITNNLMRKPIFGPEDKIYEKSALKVLLKSDPQQYNRAKIYVIPSTVEKVQKLSKETLSYLLPFFAINCIPDKLVIIVAECLSVLSLETDLEMFMRLFANDNEHFLEQLLNQLSRMIRPKIFRALLEECSGIESHQLASILILRILMHIEEPPNLEAYFDYLQRILNKFEKKATMLKHFLELTDHLTKNQLLICIETLGLHEIDEKTQRAINMLNQKVLTENIRESQASLIKKGQEKQLEEAMKLNSLGDDLFNEGSFRKAEEMYVKCLSIRQEVLPPNHLDLAVIYNNLGNTLRRKGLKGEAEKMYMKCLSIRQEILPSNHLDLANIYSNLGVTLESKGSYGDAEEMYMKCLRIRQEILSPNHLDLANIYYNLGRTLDSKGSYEDALEMYMKCLRIRQEVLPSNHLDLAWIYNNLGITLRKKGSHGEAEEMFTKCRRIRQG